MDFKEDGNNRVAYLSIKNIALNSQRGIRQAFYFVGKDLKQTANEEILSKDKTGKVYLVRLNRITRRHQASAPGQPPANLTGNLRKSIGFDVKGSEQLEFGSRSQAPQGGKAKQSVAEYAAGLEEGTSRMAPRPYLRPAIEKNQGNATQHFEREIKKALDKPNGI